jgi:hypothetical protein
VSEDTRRLLKVFGVAITDAEAEAEAEKLAATATRQPAGGKEEVAALLKDASDLFGR